MKENGRCVVEQDFQQNFRVNFAWWFAFFFVFFFTESCSSSEDLKISSPCTSKLTNLSGLTVKTDGVTGGRRDVGGSGAIAFIVSHFLEPSCIHRCSRCCHRICCQQYPP